MELPRPRPWNHEAESAARAHLDQLTKPPGSLGKIEGLGAWLSGIQGACPPRVPSRARLYTFAGDHGVTAEGVSPYPSAVTVQMVRNFLAGGAAVNVFARHHGVELAVVDVGVAGDLSACRDTDHAKFVGARARPGTGNMAVEPAMSRGEAEAAIATGIRMARAAAADGIEVIGAGEMGIGNTTAAAACLAAVHGMPGKLTAGRGTGIDDAGLARKARVIDAAIARGRPDRNDGIAILSEVGGLEIAAIAGLCLGGAEAGLPVMLDGFVSTCGGLVASVLDEGVRPYLLVSHKSAENAHWAMARSMGKEPLHDLDLRLGEGTGAVLAIDSLRLAAKVMNQMATFASAGVSNRS